MWCARACQPRFCSRDGRSTPRMKPWNGCRQVTSMIAAKMVVNTGTCLVVHEAVATAWPRFVEWLDEVRAPAAARHLRLRAAAEQWRDQGKKVDALWQGLRSSRPGRSAPLSAVGDELTGLEHDFLNASRKLETRRSRQFWGVVSLAIAGMLTIIWLFYAQMYWKEQAAVAAMTATRNWPTRVQSEAGTQFRKWLTGQPRMPCTRRGPSDSAGGFLWLLQAWDHLREKQRQQTRNVLLRLSPSPRNGSAAAPPDCSSALSQGLCRLCDQ